MSTEHNEPDERAARIKSAWPLLLLCLLYGSRWILADVRPQSGSTIASEAVAAALLAAGFAVYAIRRPARGSHSGLVQSACIGAALLAAPTLGAMLRGAAGDGFNRTVGLCFVPLFLAMARAWTGQATLRAGVGLTAVAGALLLFPLTLPQSVAGYLGLLLPPLLVTAGLALGRAHAPQARHAWAFFAGGALALGLMEAARRHGAVDASQPLSLEAILIDLALAALTLLALRRAGSRLYAARFLLTPVVTAVEGLLIFRPGMTLRVTTGMLLLAVAVVGLYRQRDEADEASLSLRAPRRDDVPN
jgi:hypothetical protein